MVGDEIEHASLSAVIPAGWYPDPAGGDGKRWWDGGIWTDNLQEPVEPPVPSTFGNYVPVDQRPARALPVAEPGIAYTRASWWLAGSPLWVVVPQAIVVEILNSLAPLPMSSVVLGIALLTTVAWGLLIRLAFADRSALINGGNNAAASAWWALLTPLAYLIVRARYVRHYATGGWASVIWWCLAAVFSPGIAVLGIFAAYGLFAN